ncbi:YhdT family protein [Virgibacillus sp. MSP4-1]|uniref:YhdT family protein n=1 Tax=Virgibacillus sp. MSP4-1 TaxID=2700081 RepID=UPI00039A6A63|nr:YhdT family protein [Virgibacillus sp. MSP4-1]QHS23388.1 YhdT family protein [Virgibacillus sp. MSP4-1]
MNQNKPLTRNQKFKIAHREALIGCALALFNFIWWYGFAYGLGSVSPDEYTYVFGFPSWFFYSCILGFIVMVLLVWAVVKFVLKEVSFDEEDEDREEERSS